MSHSKTHHSEAEASVHYPMEPDPVYPELGPAEAAGPAYSGGTSSSSLFDKMHGQNLPAVKMGDKSGLKS